MRRPRADEQLFSHALLRPAECVKRKHFDLSLGKQELLADLFSVVAHSGLPHIGQAFVMLVEAHDFHDGACLRSLLLMGHLFFGYGLEFAHVQEVNECDLGRNHDHREHGGEHQKVVLRHCRHIDERDAGDASASEPDDPSSNRIVVRAAPAVAHEREDDVPREGDEQRIEVGREDDADIERVGPSRIAQKSDAGERFHDDEDADGHDAMVSPAREHDNRDAKCEDKYKIGESRCRPKCDRRSIGVPAQKAVGTRKHADAHGDGGEEDLRRHGVLRETEEVVLAGNRLDVAGEGLLSGERYAGKLQQHKRHCVEAGDAFRHEYRGKDEQLAYKQRAECVYDGGCRGAIACAAQPVRHASEAAQCAKRACKKVVCSRIRLSRSDFQQTCHDEGKRLKENRRKGDAPHDAMRKMAFCDGNQKPQHR